MRAVSLSDKNVQKKIEKYFVPLKVTILPGTKKFPLDWPGLEVWSATYKRMGAEKCEGITACSVVTPDKQAEYGSTGSAFVWELFDSIAYDATKFAAMLDRADDRWQKERTIQSDESLDQQQRSAKLAAHRRDVKKAIAKEGRFHLPPRGFSIKGAMDLFEMTGDLPKKK